MVAGDLELRVAWERHLGDEPIAHRWFESVTNRYRESHRHYHDLRHVTWVVRHVGELSAPHTLDDLDGTVAAAFFHDAVYDPQRPDNEAASGQLAAAALTELGWPERRIAAVDELIRGTADHAVAGIPLDAAVLFAADLAVLAAEPTPYSDYVRNVRREYHHVDDAAWRDGRARVLRSFLDRPAIYAPELQLDTWERRARANLSAELATLVA